VRLLCFCGDRFNCGFIFIYNFVLGCILGHNINAERTSINPRLNELAISTFLTMTQAIRRMLEPMLATIEVDGAALVFDVQLAKSDLVYLMPFLKPAKVCQLLADTYDVDESLFDAKRVAEFAGHAASSPKRAKMHDHSADDRTRRGAADA
jgi:hypothetical protein